MAKVEDYNGPLNFDTVLQSLGCIAGKNDKTFYTKLFSGDQAFDSPDSDESPGDERHSSENKSVINKSEISLAV